MRCSCFVLFVLFCFVCFCCVLLLLMVLLVVLEFELQRSKDLTKISTSSLCVNITSKFSGSLLGNNQVFYCIRQPFKRPERNGIGSLRVFFAITESFAFSHSVSASCVSENSWLKKRMHHLRCNDGTTITVSPTSKTQTTPYQNPLVMRRTSTFKIVETNPTTESI